MLPWQLTHPGSWHDWGFYLHLCELYVLWWLRINLINSMQLRVILNIDLEFWCFQSHVMSQWRSSRGNRGDADIHPLQLPHSECVTDGRLWYISSSFIYSSFLSSTLWRAAYCFQAKGRDLCVATDQQCDSEDTEGPLDKPLLICFERRVEEVIRGSEHWLDWYWTASWYRGCCTL